MLMSEFTGAFPDPYQALGVIGKTATEAGLERPLIELVKLRSSQLNGCAYCLSFHTALAKKLGIPQAKLDLLAAWRDSPIYSERERAALAWTEALTLLAVRHPEEVERAEAGRVFGASQFMALTVTIGLINQWNRICGGLG
ncbi:MAG: carboxymuconolactone decarboxylase family protein, partial [bacterium]